MAINKIVPQYLNKDDDQRLVKQVEMVDALNVHVSADETGNSGVIKNILGTAVIPSLGLEDRIMTNDAQVVGSIAIPRKQYVIFFVYINPSTSLHHSIMLYDVAANNVKRLIATPLLNFQRDNYVQADVIFNEDDETFVYFTDGYNSPKKINVDRLISQADSIWKDPQNMFYYSDTERLEFLEVCKTPPQEPITFYYDTDDDIAKNNIIDKVFQFAYQYVYRDSEVSAISPYSKIAFSPTAFGSGIVNPAAEKENNRINLLFEPGNKEVVKVKLLGRVGTSGAFSVIGEVDNPSTSPGVFAFTNDGLFPLVPTFEVDKNFDNVPLKAGSQVIAGNRLVYGDYTEGYNNLVNFNVVPSVVYETLDATGVITVTLEQGASGQPPHIIIDGTNLSAQYEPGAIIICKFQVLGNISTGEIRIQSQASDQSGTIPIWSTIFGDTNYGFKADFGPAFTDKYVSIPFPLDKTINGGFVTGATLTRNQILNEIAANISQRSFVYNYANDGTRFTARAEVDTIYGGYPIASNALIEASMVYSDIQVDLNQDLSYNVLNKRKVNLVVTDFDVEYYDEAQTTILVNSSAVAFDVSSQPITPNLSVLRYYDSASYAGITLTTIEGLAYNPGYNSFKTSALHNFGIVYYDEKGRSGAVQKINGVYVAGYAEPARAAAKGGIEVRFEIRHQPPAWAKRYQIVYGGNENYDSFVQYSVAGAYVKDDAVVTDGDPQAIYLDLNTLQGNEASYVKDKGALIEYTYREGDIARIISYYDDNEQRQYLDGYEFLVLGTQNITDDTFLENKAIVTNERRTGTFLVIRNEDYSEKDLDQFSASAVRASSDLWGSRVMIEIVSPKRTTSDLVYYEIGHVYDIVNGAHVGDSTNGGFPVCHINNGDVMFKPRKVLYAPYDGTTYDYTDYVDYDYVVEYVESSQVSDFFESPATNRGRLHAISAEAKQMRRFASVTYSDQFAFGAGRFNLSSFNLTQGNFVDFEGRYGKIDKLTESGESIMIFQEHKVGIAGINRTFLETLSGDDVVATQNFIGTPRYYSGDFGSSGYPAAIVQRFGITYYVDVRSQKIVRIGGDGITLISDNKMGSYFDENLSQYISQSSKNEMDIVAGFDPDNDEYVLTAKPKGSFPGFTIGYGHNGGQWLSFYSFVPDLYQNINDKLLSFKTGATSVLWAHEAGTVYNNFYNQQYNSSISVISNYDPSMVKVFNAISTESTHPFSSVVETSDQRSTIPAANFQNREREFVAQVRGDELMSTANYIPIGVVASVPSATSIAFSNSINKYPIPLGATISIAGATISDTTVTISSVQDSKTLTTSTNTGQFTTGELLLAKTTASVNGDRLSDYYAKIILTNSVSNEKVELYCLNINFSRSNLHSSLGQNNIQS
jgi:hypothetical protein